MRVTLEVPEHISVDLTGVKAHSQAADVCHQPSASVPCMQWYYPAVQMLQLMTDKAGIKAADMCHQLSATVPPTLGYCPAL